MKFVNLRLDDAVHQRMEQLAARELIPITAMLRRAFAFYEAANAAPAASKNPKPLGKREQAFMEYKALIDGIPSDKSAWTVAWADHFIQSVGTQRVAAGNLSVAEMPLPPEIVAWKNAKTMQAPGAKDTPDDAGVEHDDPLADLAAIDWDSE